MCIWPICWWDVQLDRYEILLGDMRGLRWVSTANKINVNYLGATPVEGGYENDQTPLYVVKAEHKGAWHPGKASIKINGRWCHFLSRWLIDWLICFQALSFPTMVVKNSSGLVFRCISIPQGTWYFEIGLPSALLCISNWKYPHSERDVIGNQCKVCWYNIIETPVPSWGLGRMCHVSNFHSRHKILITL